jgi:hypothetical protein
MPTRSRLLTWPEEHGKENAEDKTFCKQQGSTICMFDAEGSITVTLTMIYTN